jgi:hypothetical protein
LNIAGKRYGTHVAMLITAILWDLFFESLLSCALELSPIISGKARGRGEKAAWQSRLEPVIVVEAAMS